MTEELKKKIFYLEIIIVILFALYLYFDFDRTEFTKENQLFYKSYISFNDAPNSKLIYCNYKPRENYVILERDLEFSLPYKELIEYYKKEAERSGWIKDKFDEENKGIKMWFKKETLLLYINIVETDQGKLEGLIIFEEEKKKNRR